MKKNFSFFVREYIEDESSEIYVVEPPDGGMVAQLWLHVTSNRFNEIKELWIWDLTVKSEFRRRGIGRALLQFAKSRALTLNCRELWLLVSSKNDKASQLYASEGLGQSGSLMSVQITSPPQTAESKEVSVGTAELKRLTSSDLAALYDLWKEAGLPCKRSGRDHSEHLQEFLDGQRETAWGIFREEKLIASVLVCYDGRKGWIERLAVHPEFRRSGLAQTLITAAMKTLREAGALVVAALIMDPNTASRRLFESCGFEHDPDVCYYSIRDNPDF
jgi:ribosomal protein S18 acetylase RimI-like enzyme